METSDMSVAVRDDVRLRSECEAIISRCKQTTASGAVEVLKSMLTKAKNKKTVSLLYAWIRLLEDTYPTLSQE